MIELYKKIMVLLVVGLFLFLAISPINNAQVVESYVLFGDPSLKIGGHPPQSL